MKTDSWEKYGFERYANTRLAYGPSFSKDGQSLSFITDLAGSPQMWMLHLGTKRMDQLTFYEDRVSGARFSPAGDVLIFSLDPGGSEKHQLWSFDPATLQAEKLTSHDDAIHHFGDFFKDGSKFCYASNERDDRYFDVYTRTLGSHNRKLVFQSDHTNRAVGWLGRERLVVERANTNLDTDLYLVNEESSAKEEAHCITQHSGEAYFSYAGASKDEKTIYLVTNKDGEYAQPAALDLGSGKIQVLLEDKGSDAFGGNVSDDGRYFAYFRNVDGLSKFHIYNLAEHRDLQVEGLPVGSMEGPVVSGGLTCWSPDSALLAFTFQGPSQNMNLWEYDLAEEKVEQLTSVSLAGISRQSLVEPERTRFPSFDRLQVPVLVYRPRGLAGPLPTVVYVHGGPESQETVRFNIAVQFFVNHGFLVLAPNVRGSTGYGKSWVHLDDVERRLDSVHDLEALVKWAVGRRLSLENRVGIMGGSYGGFMVLSALTEYPDIWAAGVDTVGIANFETFLERTSPWRRHLREAEYGSLEKDRRLFRRISPIHRIDKIRAPLLVIHGANDPRVPVSEAEQIVDGLKKLGRHVEYIRFEDEGHGIAKIKNRVRANTTIEDFLERTLNVPQRSD